MASGDMILTDSASVTNVSHFCPCYGPGMDSLGADSAIAIYVWILCHPLFDGAATCHCVYSGCLDAAPPAHFA